MGSAASLTRTNSRYRETVPSFSANQYTGMCAVVFSDSISTLGNGAGDCTLVAALGMEYRSPGTPSPHAARAPSATVIPSTARRERGDRLERDIGILGSLQESGANGWTGMAGDCRGSFPSLA
ncbi:hypothetical protein GCM10017711_05360 [Paeniglutamicibacter sulfureus]